MKHTEETKKKLSEMHRGKNNPFFGKKHTASTKKKLANILRKYRKNRKYDLTPSNIKIPTEIQIAYLAGIVDGEGSIGYHGSAPFVAIYNNSKNLMDWLTLNIGGTYRVSDLRGREVGYTWSVQSVMNVHELIEMIKPHLIIKTNRAIEVNLSLEKKYGKRLKH